MCILPTDYNPNDLVLKRSVDDGQTWGSIVTVVEGRGQAVSNPNPVEVDVGGGRKAILLHYDTMNNPRPSHHGRNMQVWSYDEGFTWKDAKDITLYMPPSMAGCMPGPSVGIQAPSGTIYFTCHMNDCGDPYSARWFLLLLAKASWPPCVSRAMLYWSNDSGSTWAPSRVAEGLNECSIARLPNSSLAMSCRISDVRARRTLTWSAGGELLLSPVIAQGVVDPHCQGSIMLVGGHLYMSNVNSTRARKSLALRVSEDAGLSWRDSLTLWRGKSGYSQLVSWEGEVSGQGACMIGVLAEVGQHKYHDKIAFRSFACP